LPQVSSCHALGGRMFCLLHAHAPTPYCPTFAQCVRCADRVLPYFAQLLPIACAAQTEFCRVLLRASAPQITCSGCFAYCTRMHRQIFAVFCSLHMRCRRDFASCVRCTDNVLPYFAYCVRMHRHHFAQLLPIACAAQTEFCRILPIACAAQTEFCRILPIACAAQTEFCRILPIACACTDRCVPHVVPCAPVQGTLCVRHYPILVHLFHQRMVILPIACGAQTEFCRVLYSAHAAQIPHRRYAVHMHGRPVAAIVG
jgi:hypothetical protein